MVEIVGLRPPFSPSRETIIFGGNCRSHDWGKGRLEANIFGRNCWSQASLSPAVRPLFFVEIVGLTIGEKGGLRPTFFVEIVGLRPPSSPVVRPLFFVEIVGLTNGERKA